MFELTISIEAAALKVILEAGENICIVLNAGAMATSVVQASRGGSCAPPQVLWQALTAQERTVVQWEAD